MKNAISKLINTLSRWLVNLSKFSDQLLVSGGNFLTIAICAHSLPLSEQGKLTYIYASYMAILMINVTGIFQGAAVRAPKQNCGYKIDLAKLQFIQACALSVIVTIMWSGFGDFFGWQATVTEMAFLSVYLVVQQLADFDRRSAYIFNRSQRAAYSSLALYPLRVAVLFVFRPDTLVEVTQILIVSAIVPSVPTFLTIARSRLNKEQSWFKVVKEQIHYSRMFLAGAPITWLLGYLPIFMLGLIHGKEQAGILASIRGLSNIANIFMEQVETKVVADWARVRHLEEPLVMEEAVRKLLKLGFILWAGGLFFALIFGHKLVSFFLGDAYAPHWWLLVIGWVGYGVYFFSRIYGIKHRTLGSNKIEFIGVFWGLIAGVIFGYLLIPTLNVVGAAWAYVCIYLVVMICQMAYNKLSTVANQ